MISKVASMLDVSPLGTPTRPPGSLQVGSFLSAPFYASPLIVIVAAWAVLPLVRQGVLIVVAGTAILIASVVAHEFAHAAAARLVGCRVLAVTIGWRGGRCCFDRPSRGRDLAIIVLAGPGINLLVAAVALGASGASQAGNRELLQAASLINLMLGLANLMPSYPLDGSILACLLLGRIMSHRLAMSIVAVTGYAIDAVWSCAFVPFVLFGLPLVFGIGGRNGRLWSDARASGSPREPLAPPEDWMPGEVPRWLIRCDVADGASVGPQRPR